MDLANITNWIPTAALAVVLWLARNMVKEWVTKSVQTRFDKSLEQLKSDLRTKEDEISSLRGVVLSGLTDRQVGLNKRRIEAVDQLWGSANKLTPGGYATTWTSILNLEEIRDRCLRNEEFRAYIKAQLGSYDINKITDPDDKQARPYVSDMAWAVYRAYQATIVWAVAKVVAARDGADLDSLGNADTVNNLIKAVLPHHAEFLDRHGEKGHYAILDELEDRLLHELRLVLEGKDLDQYAVEQGSRIKEALQQFDTVSAEKVIEKAKSELPRG